MTDTQPDPRVAQCGGSSTLTFRFGELSHLGRTHWSHPEVHECRSCTHGGPTLWLDPVVSPAGLACEQVKPLVGHLRRDPLVRPLGSTGWFDLGGSTLGQSHGQPYRVCPEVRPCGGDHVPWEWLSGCRGWWCPMGSTRGWNYGTDVVVRPVSCLHISWLGSDGLTV